MDRKGEQQSQVKNSLTNDDVEQIDATSIHNDSMTGSPPSSSSSDTKTRPQNGGTILILINPHSGRGKSTAIFKKKLLPILTKHDIDYDVFITNSEARVHDYILNKSSTELMNLRSIIVVSGDGLFHETLNALMARQDREQAINIPIGIIPAGSGNGLAYTLLKRKNPGILSKNDAIELCCQQAIENQTCQADLVKITFGRGNEQRTTIWSFLSLGWGLLSDIDIDSEWLRKLGEIRFNLYGVLRSLTATTYRGRLSFKIAKLGASGSQEIHKSVDRKLLDEKLRKESNTSFKMYDDFKGLEIDSEIHSKLPKGENYDDWIHIEDNFTCVYAVYQSHISSASNFAPKSTLTDQIIYLTYVRGKLSVCETVRFLLDIEDGSHENLPYVTVVPVTCFKMQPLEPGKIVIDGELISWNLSDGPLTAEVVPKAMKLVWEESNNQL